MLNSDKKRQVQKNAKAHNVYRHCLCFIFDQTTMAQEQNHSPCFNNKIVLIVMKLRLKNVIIMFTMLPGNLFQCLTDHGKKLFAC